MAFEATFLLLLHSLVIVSAAASPSSGCKCTSADPCWPSTADWAKLSAQLSHPVFPVLPPGYYCHDPHFDAALCASAQANAGSPLWRAAQPGAEQADNWEFTSMSDCFVSGNRTSPCGQGRVPALGVNATTVSDVQRALAFAFQRNLKVHVKNTGHDFLGRGLGPGSLMIWTHYFRHTDFSDQFTYAGGQKGGFPAVTVGPGIQWADAYAFADSNNVEIPGGVAPYGSVGAGGGWALGAGHNIISPTLGLGADNVVEIDLVLPNGTLVTANQYQHTDLFWAVRGGGGPSFGVSTRLVYKAHPRTPLYAEFFEAAITTNDAYLSLLDSWHIHLPALSDAGWSGYYIFQSPAYFALMYLLPHGTPALGNSTMGSFISTAKAIPGVTIKTDASTSYPNYNSWLVANIMEPVKVVGYNYTGGIDVTGGGVATASWLLPRNLFTNSTTAHSVSEAVAGMPGGIGQHVGGGVVSQQDVDFNAVHPAWRSSLVDFVVFAPWTDGTSNATVDADRQFLSDLLAPLRALTPGGGQYLNEPDALMTDYTSANWGAHYDRLLTIKNSIDPTSQLLVAQGVGAVGWDAEQICPL